MVWAPAEMNRNGPNYTVEELSAIVREAHALDKKTAAHTHSTEASRRCIEAGIDTIEHGCGLNDEMCARMAENGQFLIPTMRVVNQLLRAMTAKNARRQKRWPRSMTAPCMPQ